MEDIDMKITTQYKTLLVITILLTLISPALSGMNNYRGEQNSLAAPIKQNPAAIDAAPNPPTLNSPADGATGVSIPPTLSVGVSDPDPGNLTVTFFGRVHSPDFTLAVLPDTQKYTTNGSGIFGTQTQWIVAQQAAKNIVFVSHLGGMVDDWNVPDQWAVVNAAMGNLEPSIPYGIGVGNTDEDNYGVPPGTTVFNSVFPASRFAGRPYYGGAYNGDNANSYQLFSASGMDFIVINLQYNLSYYPDKALAILTWADTLLKNNSNRRAIVVTHYLLNTSNEFSADGSLIYNELKDNPNLFLMMGGHLDTEGQRSDTYNGHTIYSLRSDYSTRPNGGNGWLRLLTFSPDTNTINVTTYSPTLNQYETDADSQFSLSYAMGGVSFQEIGSTNVPQGNVNMAWPGLLPGKQYQWYVNVNDGGATTAGPIWSFTTAPANAAPVITSQPSSQTVTAGNTAFFTATASGYPAPTVQWQVSTNGTTWTNISGATSTTYSFIPQYADNLKQYRAVFTNGSGSVNSSAAILTVNTVPTVTTQPASQTVNALSTATFSAVASGVPAPTIQWQVSITGTIWTNIAGATVSPYTFTAQAADNAKQYRAVFTNVAGSVNSNAAVLTVNFAPAVTTQPVNQTVTAGQTATFTAAASGNPIPTVQWQVSTNGTTWTNIAGATVSPYSFTAAAADTGKQYRAVFNNSRGSATSNAATLTVNTIPLVTTQPVDQSVTAGQTGAFSAAASGSPTPTVQWQVSTNSGATWTNITGATSTTYSFTAQVGDTGKQYHAVFTNVAGSATSNAATLTVNTPPVVTIHPVNQTVNSGQTATFTAAASGSPAPTVQWQVSTNGTTWTNIVGATSATYSFTTAAADNGKQYRAVFTNTAGSVNSNAAVLTVYFAPTVTTQPVNQSFNVGQTATFSAAASGNPAPTVQWQVSTNGTTWSDIAGATSTTYSFTTQSTDNGKQYRAVFTNFLGSATSSAATLTLNIAPTVTTQPVNQTVNAGQTATFSAAASGNPVPTVQWQVSTNGTTWSNISGATSTTYSFTAQAGDNGKQYRAVFTNAAGSVNSNAATLTVNSAPAVTTQPSNQLLISGQTATFTAAASGNPVPTVQWQVSTNGTTWSDIAGATSATYSFTAQAADNGKQYRAVFTNSRGSATSSAALLRIGNLVFLPIVVK
jgi:hypothetical protein